MAPILWKSCHNNMLSKDVGQVCISKDVVDFSVVFYCKVDLATDVGKFLEGEYVRDPVDSEVPLVLCDLSQGGHEVPYKCATNLWPIAGLLRQPSMAA